MAVQLSTYSEPLEGPSRMGKNMNTSNLSMSAPISILGADIDRLEVFIRLSIQPEPSRGWL